MKKKVALIGDSIRMGYQPFVKNILHNKVDIWGPSINGGDSRNILVHLSEWLVTAKPDIIHINCGLHDIKTPFNATLPSVLISEYQQNISTILHQLLAKVPCVIWATTTPVNSEWHHRTKGFDRFESDVIAYNIAAQEEARALSVPINDLYQIVMDTGLTRVLHTDGVHFNLDGYRLLADSVVKSLHLML